MTSEMIQSLCIRSTAAYLDFLIENELGIEKIRVIGKERIRGHDRQVFKLSLESRLFDPDCVFLEVQPPRQTFGPDCFRVVEYDGDTKTLIVEVSNPELALDTRPAESVHVISDLRFLVRNVERWFETNGNMLQFPKLNRDMGSIAVQKCAPACQREAISTSLAKPMTYIWGPPGTGKTKHVLPQSVILLLQADKRVGVFAPTNNALEQAMEAIINAAAYSGIGRDKFLRVGHPSAKFARDFPEVCEIQGLERRLNELREQINVYDIVLNHRRGATVLNSVPVMQQNITKLRGLLSERNDIYQQLARLRRNPLSRIIHSWGGSLDLLDERRTNIETQINGLLEMIRLTRTASSKLNALIDRIDFINIQEIQSDIAKLESDARDYMNINHAITQPYEGQTSEEIQELKSDLEKQAETLRSQTVLERIKVALVTGMTLDCFIGRFHKTILPFDHIFLDEAGYAPLVKAATLCRGDIPMTFIGDHKQLGPVCEMNDENLGAPSNQTAILWKKSALFVDELFLSENADALISRLFEMVEPALQCFTPAKLNTTFRFGQNLADILSECV